MNRKPGKDHGGQDELPLIVLTGFMGTGKTETGRALAGILGLDFADMDTLIEAREGAAVTAIFRDQGEDRFRALEEELSAELAERRGLVVATGGGTLVSKRNFDAFSRRGTVVLLEAAVPAIAERVGTSKTRPLLAGAARGDAPIEERIRSILEERESAYKRIKFRIDTTDITPREAALHIAAGLDMPYRAITISVPEGSPRALPDAAGKGTGTSPPSASRIEIGRGLLSALGERLRSLGPPSTVFVVMPDTVRRHHAGQIAASLDAASLPWTDVSIRDGDGEKTLLQAAQIIDRFVEHRGARDAAVVAVGGGVTGDLAGFAASIYLRGIPLVQVPTTLLAQVDASIGGKTGVNHPRAKNLIGCFYQPLLVLSDPCTLRTLDDGEIANGMAEVVKTAMIGSAGLFEFIETELAAAPASRLREIGFLERCVSECAAVKAGIVQRDPFEAGERRFLNLGHTLGHALEAAASYEGLDHGQAVSIGLVAAVRIAVARKLVPASLHDRTKSVLERCGLPVEAPPFEKGALLEALHLDKKKKAGRLHCVLPVRLGAVTVVDDVADEELLASL